MKRTIPLLFALVLIFSFCKNNLTLQAPYKDISIVYCLLDQNDTTHYIRINKAFDGQGNAYAAAKQYDSINYPIGTLTVQIQDYSNGNLVNTIPFAPTTNIPLDTGIFASPANIIYYSKQALNPNDQYNLLIVNTKTGKKITGSTTLLQDVYVTTPSAFLAKGTLDLQLDNYSPTQVTWNTIPGTTIYQAYIRLFYTEIDTVKKDSAVRFVDWVFPARTAPNTNGGYTLFFNYSGSEFYQILAQNIPTAYGTSLKRIMDTAHVIFVSGSDDLSTYIQLSQPSLGVNQDKPTFSDIKNAYGIYSSRHVQVVTKTIAANQVALIEHDSITNALNFR